MLLVELDAAFLAQDGLAIHRLDLRWQAFNHLRKSGFPWCGSWKRRLVANGRCLVCL